MTAPDPNVCFALLKPQASALVDHCLQRAENPEAFWLPHFGF
jgi:hypothetical protein